jgi:hypothetical protein
MGRRTRRRGREAGAEPELAAEASRYEDDDGNVLVLRGSMSPRTRRKYASVLSGHGDAPGATREDAWHRAVEFLFERLVVSWEIAGLPLEGQKALLERFRVASQEERAWIRAVLREHLTANFPELEAP